MSDEVKYYNRYIITPHWDTHDWQTSERNRKQNVTNLFRFMTEHQLFGKDAPLFAPNACAVSQLLPLHLYKSYLKYMVLKQSPERWWNNTRYKHNYTKSNNIYEHN